MQELTSQYVYAQAFKIERPVNVRSVSLAMRKFGGDGTVYTAALGLLERWVPPISSKTFSVSGLKLPSV